MKIIYLLVFFSLCTLCNTPLGAQTLDSAKVDTVQKVRENWYWYQVDLGLATGGSYHGNFVGSCSLNMAFDDRIVSVRGTLNVEGSKAIAQVLDIGALYGWTSRADWAFSSFAVGLAYTHVPLIEYPSRDVSYRGPALIVEANAVLKAYLLGVGITLTGNINPVRPYIGAMLSLYFGWMP